jgi:hypothetical protein
VIPIVPAVDATIWQPRRPPREWMRPQWSAGADDTVLLFAGRLDSDAQADLLAGAMRQLVEQALPVRLVVAGEGRGIRRLEDLVAAHGLGERVRFLGAQSTETWIRMMSAADVFLAPEGEAIAAIRAMACGLPLVGQEDGRAFTLADRVAELVRDPARRRALGRAARERAIAEFGPDHLARRLLELLAEPAPARREPEPVVGAFEAAVTCFELVHTYAELDQLARENADARARIAILESGHAALEARSAWLEGQVGHWRRTAEAHGAASAERLQRIRELESSRRWLEEELEFAGAPREPA